MNNLVPFRPKPIAAIVVQPPSVEGRLPPFDLTAEGAVLSAILTDESMDRAAFGAVSSFLKPEHFFSERHARIYEGIVAVMASNEPFDIVSLQGWLKDRNRLMQIGGIEYLQEVINSVPFVLPRNVEHFGLRVQRLSRVRNTILACMETIKTAYGEDGIGDPEEFIQDHLKRISTISTANPTPAVETNLETFKRTVGEIFTSGGARRRMGLSTSLPALDEVLAGLRPGKKITISAHPGRGKTVMAIQIAMAAARQGVRVLLVTPEVEREEVIFRMTSSLASVNYNSFRVGSLTPEEGARVIGVSNEVTSLPIDIVDTDVDVDQIMARARSMVNEVHIGKPPLGLVVVDYLGRLAVTPAMKSRERHEQVGHDTKALKVMARTLKIPVVEMAQPAGDHDTEPRVCAESGKIRREADTLIFVHHDKKSPRDSMAIIDKNRDGLEGARIPLRFESDYMRFREYE